MTAEHVSGSCDICGATIGPKAPVISAAAMRIIVASGYGRHLAAGDPMRSTARQLAFAQLVLASDSPWALCVRCFESARAYFPKTGAGGAELHYFEGHTDQGPTTVAISRDGRRALSAGWDKVVFLWDLTNGSELRRFNGHTDFVKAAIFLGDGARAATAGADRTVRIWDCERGSEIARLEKHSFTIFDMRASDDGTLLLTASGDSTARLWDTTKGVHIRKLGGFFGGSHKEALRSCDMSGDGRFAVTAGKDVKTWDLATGQEIRAIGGFSYGINQIVMVPGTSQAIGLSGTDVIRFDLQNGREIAPFSPDLPHASRIAISADGMRLAASRATDSPLEVFDRASGRSLYQFSGHTKMVEALAFSPDGKLLASASMDKTVRIWSCP